MRRQCDSSRAGNALARALVAVCFATDSLAADFQWASGVSGNWVTNANWSPSGLPTGAGNTATISAAPLTVPYTVSLLNGVSSLGGLTLDQAGATLLVGGGGQLGMAGPVNLTAGTLSVNGGSLAGTGAFTLSPGATLKTFSNVTMPAGMMYSLGGSIIAEGTLQGFPASGVTNNGSITMTGAGLAWLFSPPLTNNGTITADGAGGGTARLQTRITNSATGVITLLTNTETFTSPQNNSGVLALAAGKSLTIGSFATVNQNAGSMTLSGAYTHLNGTFNMNGGTLTIPVGGSMLKDGGGFVYNGGSIAGEPTLHNAFLTLNPGATAAASFRIRGPSNGLSGDVPASVTLDIEATPTEAALTGVVGGFTNRGAINLIGDAVNQAGVAGVGVGTLVNRGVIAGKRPAGAIDVAGGGRGALTAFGCVIRQNLANEQEARLEAEAAVKMQIDFTLGNHVNRGTISIKPSQGPYLPGSIIWPGGGQQTIVQESGTIDNQGSCLVGAGNTFEFVGGVCTGNPIEIEGGGLGIGPDAGAGSFDLLGGGNIITADEIDAALAITFRKGADEAGGQADWAPEGFVTPSLGGEMTIETGGSPGPRLNMQQTLLVLQTGVISIVATQAVTPVVLNVNNLPLEMRGRLRWDEQERDDGAGPGVVVRLLGDYTQTATGVLAPRMRAAHSADTLELVGAFGSVAILDGTLEVGIGPGYAPAWGDDASIMTYALRLGDFSNFSTPALPANLRWWREAGATAYTVGVRHLADTNHDGVVDFIDLNNVLSYFGEPAPGGSAAAIGDANTDGVVDFLDLNGVLGYFGLAR